MKYNYVGKGEGIPGLPHEITDAQAKDLGVAQILKEAVANGSYKSAEKKPPKKKE